jgi:4-oxalocrotonate tautomerase
VEGRDSVCGICGELTTNGEPASVAALQTMTECMRSRGPDAAGVHVQDGAGFGHRRLSIIDLSDAAQKRDIVQKLTEAMVSIEGENMRSVTWCVIDEVHSGEWAIGGNPLTTADVRALAAGQQAAT